MDLEIQNCKTPVRRYTYLPSVKVENCDFYWLHLEEQHVQDNSRICKQVISMKLKLYSRGLRDCFGSYEP
jgi:hypothetical protein